MRRIGPQKPPYSPAPPPLSGTSAEVNRRQLTPAAAGGATTRWAAGASDARAAEATFRQIAGGRIRQNSPLLRPRAMKCSPEDDICLLFFFPLCFI